ncbi:hypothetical protein BDQ94DRAFT_139883 [Aspergillus welwitschiae]|uniref:Uncharacterized protein n=1 Tax=Aspergillus welwitschiae TaxID=1341132 RepID=A0A3F3Q8Z4_9EURO|nr:hypothetical protein BDQ94DRAFT_139883 [Aspergillus welwitschiae]RDH35605.1 hypothetical protein BDQ94DRAFT_139883 [Aspergillus welwitschiae]
MSTLLRTLFQNRQQRNLRTLKLHQVRRLNLLSLFKTSRSHRSPKRRRRRTRKSGSRFLSQTRNQNRNLLSPAILRPMQSASVSTMMSLCPKETLILNCAKIPMMRS